MNSEQFDAWLLQNSHSSSTVAFRKPLVMGILNCTRDSFFDGGRFFSLDKACEQADNLINQGADIIDIGGESTKPGVEPVTLDAELQRVIPVIEQIRKYSDIAISIDTYKPVVMEAAVHAGATMVNDIYALRHRHAIETAAKLAVPVCLMHMQGTPKNMQINPTYSRGVVAEIKDFFAERISVCSAAGISKSKLILDPGFGYGKYVQDNLQIMRELEQLNALGFPLLLGVSRKNTIGVVLNKEVNERLSGSLALVVYAALQGVAVVRVHDVDETNQALEMIKAIYTQKVWVS